VDSPGLFALLGSTAVHLAERLANSACFT